MASDTVERHDRCMTLMTLQDDRHVSTELLSLYKTQGSNCLISI